MPWQYVGGISGAGTSTGYTVSLAGTLTGGIATSPAPGDLVVVFSAFGNTASSAPAVSGNSSGAYTGATAAQHVNDTWDTEFRSFYAVMGGTPDATLTITRATNGAYGGATVVQVWRGVNSASPFIGAGTPASGVNTSLVNPPAYNPGVTDALIIAGGAGTQSPTGAAFTGFTGMSNFRTQKGDGTTSDIDVAMASFLYAGSSYDPPVVSGGSGGNASSSWAGVTLAFRLYVAPTLAVQGGAHGHSTDAVGLTLQSIIAVAEAGHAHAVDNLILTAAASENLIVAESTHAHAADALDLSSNAALVVAESTHAHAADALALSSNAALIVAESTHAHAADALALSSNAALVVAESAHAHAADALALSSSAALVVAESAHAHAVDSLTLSADSSPNLSIAHPVHAHAAEGIVFSVDAWLGVDRAAHAHAGDVVALSSAAFLSIFESAHMHYAAAPQLADGAPWQPAPALPRHPLDYHIALAAKMKYGVPRKRSGLARLGWPRPRV